MFPEWIILFDWGRFKFKVESKNKQQQLFKKNYIFLFQKLSIFLLIRSTWEHHLPGICPHPWHLLLSKRTPWALKTRRQWASALEWRRESQPSRAVTGVGWLEEEALIWSRSRPRTAPGHSEVKLHAITYPVTTDSLSHHQTWPCVPRSVLWGFVGLFFSIKWKYLLKEYFRCIPFYHQEGGNRTSIDLCLFSRTLHS